MGARLIMIPQPCACGYRPLTEGTLLLIAGALDTNVDPSSTLQVVKTPTTASTSGTFGTFKEGQVK